MGQVHSGTPSEILPIMDVYACLNRLLPSMGQALFSAPSENLPLMDVYADFIKLIRIVFTSVGQALFSAPSESLPLVDVYSGLFLLLYLSAFRMSTRLHPAAYMHLTIYTGIVTSILSWMWCFLFLWIGSSPPPLFFLPSYFSLLILLAFRPTLCPPCPVPLLPSLFFFGCCLFWDFVGWGGGGEVYF